MIGRQFYIHPATAEAFSTVVVNQGFPFGDGVRTPTFAFPCSTTVIDSTGRLWIIFAPPLVVFETNLFDMFSIFLAPPAGALWILSRPPALVLSMFFYIFVTQPARILTLTFWIGFAPLPCSISGALLTISFIVPLVCIALHARLTVSRRHQKISCGKPQEIGYTYLCDRPYRSPRPGMFVASPGHFISSYYSSGGLL